MKTTLALLTLALTLAAASVAMAAAPPATATSTNAPAAGPAPSATGFAFKDTPGQYLDVFMDGRPVARYMYAFDEAKRDLTFKPFLHVFDAEGKDYITKGPGGLWTHHRGIFYGWQSITFKGKKYNLWEMPDGNQVHTKFSVQKAEADKATFTSVIDWKLKDGTKIIEEERTFTFYRRPAPTLVLIDFASTVKAVAGNLLLDGNVEHGGVHFRAADAKEGLDVKATKYLDPKATDWVPGGVGSASKIGKAPWTAMTFAVRSATYYAEEMSAPTNPKDIEWSAYRDYGRFGAFWPKNEVKDGQTFSLHCRFWVTTKAPTAAEFQKQYDDYAKESAK